MFWCSMLLVFYCSRPGFCRCSTKKIENLTGVASVLLLLCTNLMLLLLASKVPVGSSDQAMPLEGCSWLMNLQENQSSVFFSETTCRVRPQTGAGMAAPRCRAPSSPAASFSSQLSLHRLPHLLPPGALWRTTARLSSPSLGPGEEI